MPLNAEQTARVKEIWQSYLANGEHFKNAGDEFSRDELDQRRRITIPEVLNWLQRFFNDEVPIEEFKTAIDGINKRNRLWGFKGIKGQMFFNMLTRNSQIANRLDDLTNILKQTLPLPDSIEAMRDRIKQLSDFTRQLGANTQDHRTSPKIGSIPFFVSYFWQIQDPDKIPVYYSSMVNVLSELEIWSPEGDVVADYLSFYCLNQDMVQLLSTRSRQLHLWDVEHAFWFHSQLESQPEPIAQPPIQIETTVQAPQVLELLESYIPPIVSILPRLAINDEQLALQCQQSGRSLEKVFEERIAILFRMLGYEVDQLGQGHGRVPDGVAISREYRYAIIYDAKARQNAYTMGIDERSIREYISGAVQRQHRHGIHNVYFMVISGSFSGDHDDVIRGIKIDTDVREVLLVEASALLAMLEGRLRNPEFNLGPEGVQRLLANSGILTAAETREFFSF